MPFMRRKNERCALEKMGKQRKSPPQARLLPATWQLLPATAATKRLDFCGEGRRLNGQGLTMLPQTVMRPARLTETQPMGNKENEDPNASNKELGCCQALLPSGSGRAKCQPCAGQSKGKYMDKT